MLVAVLALLVVAAFILKELVAVRKQVSSLRQFQEWFALAVLEPGKDSLTPAMRDYMERAKQDLIREGLREGTLTQQQVNDLKMKQS